MSNQICLNTQTFINQIFSAEPVIDMNPVVQTSNEKRKLVVFNPDVARLPRLSDHESLISWLLRASGILDKDVIKEAFEIALLHGVDPFDILTMTGMLSNLDLKLARQASQLVSSNLIYRGFAATAIAYASKNYMDLQSALSELDLSPQAPFKRNPLVILLEKANILPARVLQKAQQEALSTGVTVGWVLIQKNLCGHNQLKTMLESLIAVQNGRIDFIHVLSLIERSFKQDNLKNIDVMVNSHLETHTQERFFGNFLLSSGNLNLPDWLFCAEVAVSEHMSMFEVCSELNVVKPASLDGINQLAQAFANKQVPARQCTMMLEQFRKQAA
ncbi:MAG: hypothetical protein SFY67_12295 [Candidatus Melainabacteria bacterium]|nr:hypothetical protein [Candidatus Melainabacteria bacterium]